jgi:hypothetical protein
MECVGIHSLEGGPELTTSLLRKIEPLIRDEARSLFTFELVRLVELEDGTIGATNELMSELAVLEKKGAELTHGDLRDMWALFDARYERQRRSRPGRKRLDPEHLERVAALYREAGEIGRPHGEHIAAAFPGYSPETIRNWVRRARDEGKLGPAPRERRAGEQKGDSHA